MAAIRLPTPHGVDIPLETRQRPASRFHLPGPVGRLFVNGYGANSTSGVSQRPPAQRAIAQDLVLQFARRLGAPVFPHLGRRVIAEGLLARLDEPGLIDQAVSSLCGPASLLFDLATRDPVQYVRFAIDLFDFGVARIGQLQIEPGADLRAYAPPSGQIHHLDWMTLASIRDSENWFLDYDEVTDQLAGITLPGELADWFEQAGYRDVRNETNLVFSNSVANANAASELFQNRFRVCLFINSKMLSVANDSESSAFPDHWVVLRSPITMTTETVNLEIFTWGEGNRRVPSVGLLRQEDFLEHYYGYVACRF